MATIGLGLVAVDFCHGEGWIEMVKCLAGERQGTLWLRLRLDCCVAWRWELMKRRIEGTFSRGLCRGKIVDSSFTAGY